MSALEKLDGETIKTAAKLEIPHHEGAGGVEDFTTEEAFQKHVRRTSHRLKRKRAHLLGRSKSLCLTLSSSSLGSNESVKTI